MATLQRKEHPLAFGQDGIHVISPEVATEWLRHAAPNRTLRPANLQRLIRAMTASAWQVDGQTIKFYEDGRLFDGQHRLQAVVQTGITIRSYVIFGLPLGSQKTVDTGLKRSSADVLHLLGETDSTNLSATLRWVWRYDRQKIVGYTASDTPTAEDLLGILETHPGIRASLVYGTLTQRLIQRSWGSALHHLASRLDDQEANRFFRRVANGEGLLRTMPLYLLRNRLISNSQSKAKLLPSDVGALVIKAWNATRQGQTLRFLKWQSGHGEVFPQLV
jgi:hypothetical protein